MYFKSKPSIMIHFKITIENKYFLPQGNVFRCNLDSDFRQFECQQSDISIKYLSSTITSPQLGFY